MRLPIHIVVVNLGLECPFELAGGSAEDDRVPSRRYTEHGEPLRLQPRRDLANVVLAEPKPLRILLGGEPLVVVRRRGVLLVCHHLVERPLLAGRG